MSSWYPLIKWLHIVSSTVLLDTGAGIAFFYLLALTAGFPPSSPGLVRSMLLYVVVGCCWLPVVWLQMRMRDLAIMAAANGSPLPVAYQRYYRSWFALGWPAFIGCW